MHSCYHAQGCSPPSASWSTLARLTAPQVGKPITYIYYDHASSASDTHSLTPPLITHFNNASIMPGGTDAWPEFKPWDPAVAQHLKYPITTYQPTYFVADSLVRWSGFGGLGCEEEEEEEALASLCPFVSLMPLTNPFPLSSFGLWNNGSWTPRSACVSTARRSSAPSTHGAS